MFCEKKYQLKFYNTAYDESGSKDFFGCASLGFATENEWFSPCEDADVTVCDGFKGILINASLEEALKQAEEISQSEYKEKIKAGIIFFGNCGKENDFMKKLCSFFPGVGFVGGSPAIGEDGKIGRCLPENAQVSALLLTDEEYDFKTGYMNVHDTIIEKAKVCGNKIRHISNVVIDGKETSLYNYIHDQAEKYGVAEGITERFAISDEYNRNIHLIADGKEYICGADLPENRNILIRYTSLENVVEKMSGFYNARNSIIFGCAGVKSMLGENTFKTGEGSVGLFMFGEVVNIGEKSDFANLTLARLEITKK